MNRLAPVKPMEPVSRDTPFSNPDYVYQIKWDGIRMLSYVQNGDVQLVNRKLHNRSIQYPDLVSSLKDLVDAKSAILDGEIIAFGPDGKPRFSQVLKRDLVTDPFKIPLAVKDTPVMYVVFDILYVNDGWIVERPLLYRIDLLSRILIPSATVQICDNYDDGNRLFEQVKALDMEGIVMKERNGTYHIGQKHPTWYKVKNMRTLNAVVGGVTLKGGVVNSLLLGAYQGNQLLFIGKAGSGLTNDQTALLTSHIPSLKTDRSPFVNPPKLPGKNYVWFHPVLSAELEFMEWTEDLTLRSPVIKSFGKANPAQCILQI